MLGLRNLYRVFQESRSAARRRATLAVTGDVSETDSLADLLGARGEEAGAEVTLAVTDARDGDVEVSLSGEAVE